MASNSPIEVNNDSETALSSNQMLEFDDDTLRGKEKNGLILDEVFNFFALGKLKSCMTSKDDYENY